MSINFIDVLVKPLKPKNLLILILSLALLFLPAILSANYLGTENLIFKIALAAALIISNGYLWSIFQNEVQEDSNNFPKWNFISNFFIGLKGLIFFIASAFVLAVIIFILWLILQRVPDFKNAAYIIAGICSIYWLLMFNAVAMGLFSENFNPLEALNLTTIVGITIGCWLDYLKAFLYIAAYALIIGMMYWAAISIIGTAYSTFILGFFIVYATIVYFSLYAKIFKQIRTS